MKPEKFIGIMLITVLMSCEMEEQPGCSVDRLDQTLGEVTFETNQYMMNTTFDIDIFIDGKKINKRKRTINEDKILIKNLAIGIHNYQVKVYSYNGEPSKTIQGRFMIEKNKKSEVFIDFKNYNSWI